MPSMKEYPIRNIKKIRVKTKIIKLMTNKQLIKIF